MNEMRRLMEAVRDVSHGHVADKSLAILAQELEQPYDNVYVKLREEYSKDVAEKYMAAFNTVWEILEKEIEYGHEGYYPEPNEGKINEASDFDGPELDALIAQFEKTCKAFRIGSFPRKQKDLLNLVMARAEDTQDMSGLGHDNALGNDHNADFGGWPDKQR